MNHFTPFSTEYTFLYKYFFITVTVHVTNVLLMMQSTFSRLLPRKPPHPVDNDLIKLNRFQSKHFHFTNDTKNEILKLPNSTCGRTVYKIKIIQPWFI